MSRRRFVRRAGTLAAASALPISLVEVALGDQEESFTFAHISDSHIQHIDGDDFVRNWDRGLIRAVAEANLLRPKPDFVVFGGDLAQLGTKAELDHGAEMLEKLDYKTYCVMGEHDYYLDLDRWPTAKQRMLEMAGLDNPNGSPFMVGEEQREWLSKDLGDVDKDTPIVIFSHSPIQKLYKGWNFWTDDAEEIHEILEPFDKTTVVYGHVHQIQYNQIGSITFHAVMATAWPWPYPESYAQADHDFPAMTVPMNRADPFFERDATGWQFIDLEAGNTTVRYNLNNNQNRVVAFNPATGQPEDLEFQDPTNRIPAQIHY